MTASARPASRDIGSRALADALGCDRHELARAGFFDRDRHSEALALLYADALKARRPEAAFMFADRMCRLSGSTAYNLMLRAIASRLMSETRYAEADLARAFEIDPTHDLIIANVLAWGAPALKPIAAASYLDGESQDRNTLRLAMQALQQAATPIVSRMRVREGMHEGWVAWHGEGTLTIVIQRCEKRASFDLQPDASHPLACRAWSAAQIAIEIESPRLESVTFRLDGEHAHTICPAWDRSKARFPLGKRVSCRSRSEVPDHVEVIVPVYGDYAATKVCLDALEAEGSRVAKHITVIDDCSPDIDIRRLVEDRAARGLCTLVRNEENIGFARSVNRVLARVVRGDVLLLNADTIVPRESIDRLALAAHSEPGIATVTPLSNNGEYTSFPKPNDCNALPKKEEIFALDEIAAAANGRELVDLPSGVGFCLFITRECLKEVGLLSETYSRGYFEDVDYCLRAREAGFRNVCATGIYVGHVGNRSFENEKRRLVVRNLAILNERFPDYERECSAFVEADPLKSARANLEERLGPEGTVVLLLASAASGPAFVFERARQIEGQGDDLHCIHCEVGDGNDRMTLKSVRGSAPQSLTFALDDGADFARLRAYLTGMQPQAIEVIAPYALPDPVLHLAYALQIPMRIALGDLDWLCDRDFVFAKACPNADRPGECHACVDAATPAVLPSKSGHADDRRGTRALTVRAESIAPMDRMAAAFCVAHLKSATQSHRAPVQDTPRDTVRFGPRRITLGVLCPEAAVEAVRLVLAVERTLDEQLIQASVVVLGRCSNELGLMSKRRIFVTNIIAEDEYERVLRQYRITHLLSPYRTRRFGLVDRLSAAIGLAKGYFDWSFGALDLQAGDLALDPRICFERAARQIGAWIADREFFVNTVGREEGAIRGQEMED